MNSCYVIDKDSFQGALILSRCTWKACIKRSSWWRSHVVSLSCFLVVGRSIPNYPSKSVNTKIVCSENRKKKTPGAWWGESNQNGRDSIRNLGSYLFTHNALPALIIIQRLLNINKYSLAMTDECIAHISISFSDASRWTLYRNDSAKRNEPCRCGECS